MISITTLAGCVAVSDEVACLLDERTLLETFDIATGQLEVLSEGSSEVLVAGDASVSVLQLCGAEDISVLNDLETDPVTSLDIQQVVVDDATGLLLGVAPPLGPGDEGTVRVAGAAVNFRSVSPGGCAAVRRLASDLEARRCGAWVELRVLSTAPAGDVAADARLLQDGEIVPIVQRLDPRLTVWAPLRRGARYELEPGVVDRETGDRAVAPVIEFRIEDEFDVTAPGG